MKTITVDGDAVYGANDEYPLLSNDKFGTVEIAGDRKKVWINGSELKLHLTKQTPEDVIKELQGKRFINGAILEEILSDWEIRPSAWQYDFTYGGDNLCLYTLGTILTCQSHRYGSQSDRYLGKPFLMTRQDDYDYGTFMCSWTLFSEPIQGAALYLD